MARAIRRACSAAHLHCARGKPTPDRIQPLLPRRKQSAHRSLAASKLDHAVVQVVSATDSAGPVDKIPQIGGSGSVAMTTRRGTLPRTRKMAPWSRQTPAPRIARHYGRCPNHGINSKYRAHCVESEALSGVRRPARRFHERSGVARHRHKYDTCAQRSDHDVGRSRNGRLLLVRNAAGVAVS